MVVHVQTEKGRGYQPAEEHPDRFHGTGPFDIPSGQPLVKKEKPNYTDVFSTVITKIAAKDDRVVATTAPLTFFASRRIRTRSIRLCPSTGPR